MRPSGYVVGTLALLAGLVAGLLSGCGFVQSGQDDDEGTATAPATLQVTSSAFADGAAIPATYTCDGPGTSPPLAWSGLPDGSRSVALVVDDPDAPGGTFVHWVVYDVDPGQTSIGAGEVPDGARQAKNGAGSVGWTGPCPPSGTHHYRFSVYVLRSPLTIPAGSDPHRVLDAVRAKATAQGTLTGTYAKQ